MGKKKCPYCGSTNTARIQYGLPAFDEKLIADIDAGKVHLGGCCITGYDPKRHCNDCGENFDYPKDITKAFGAVTLEEWLDVYYMLFDENYPLMITSCLSSEEIIRDIKKCIKNGESAKPFEYEEGIDY